MINIREILEKDFLTEEEIIYVLFSLEFTVLFHDGITDEGYIKALICSDEENYIKNVYITEETYRKLLEV